jgi:opacity protein-like surface antigen
MQFTELTRCVQMTCTGLLLMIAMPISGEAQLRGEEPGPAPARPGDRPPLTAPERARTAEVQEMSGRHFPGEGYVGLFGGVTIGHEFSDARVSGGPQLGDRNLVNSGVYGAKIGYFLPGRMDWLGVELEGFNSNPHIEQSGGDVGRRLQVSTLAANVIARTWLACGTRRDDQVRRTSDGRFERQSMDLPFCRVQPYAGVGLGAFFARSRIDGDSSLRDSSPGLNFLAGVRYYFTDNVAMFGEYKFNYASLHLSNPDTASGLRGDYTASHVVVGVSLHY